MHGSVTMTTSSENTVPSGVTISRRSVSAIPSPSPVGDFFDAALHVEVAFRHGVVLAVEDLLEAAHRIGHLHLFALAPREDLRHAKGLAQESLNSSRPVDRCLVFRRELVHPEDGYDVLQILEALQHPLHAT